MKCGQNSVLELWSVDCVNILYICIYHLRCWLCHYTCRSPSSHSPPGTNLRVTGPRPLRSVTQLDRPTGGFTPRWELLRPHWWRQVPPVTTWFQLATSGSNSHYAYLLSFPKYTGNDLLIENLHFLPLLLTALSFEATAKELPLGSMVWTLVSIN